MLDRLVFNHFGRLIAFVYDDHARPVRFHFHWRRQHEAHDDHAMTHLCEHGRGPIDPNHTAAGLTGNDVGFKAIAVVAIGDDDRFIGKQPADFQQIGIDGNAAVVIHISEGDDGAMDFRFQKFREHLCGGL